MREIKFRAWEYAHEFTNRPGWKDSPFIWKMNYEPEIGGGETFYEGDCVNLNKALANGGDADYEKENKSVFMRYTGLKDKNGVEIYEDDIVQYYGTTVSDFRRKVSFHNGTFGYESKNGDFYPLGFTVGNNGTNRSYEVIGNIHENPELLKESTNV